MKPLDCPQAGWTRNRGDVYPLLITLEYVLRNGINAAVQPRRREAAPSAGTACYVPTRSTNTLSAAAKISL